MAASKDKIRISLNQKWGQETQEISRPVKKVKYNNINACITYTCMFVLCRVNPTD